MQSVPFGGILTTSKSVLLVRANEAVFRSPKQRPAEAAGGTGPVHPQDEQRFRLLRCGLLASSGCADIARNGAFGGVSTKGQVEVDLLPSRERCYMAAGHP